MWLFARWVVPVASPPIEYGAVRVEGERITYVGPANEARGRPDAEDLGDAILLPGFINAHTHLELTRFEHLAREPVGFWTWVERLIAARRADPSSTADRDSIIEGARRSLLAGVTCVADISRTGASVDALAGLPIRKVCFVELISGARQPPSTADELIRRVDELRPRADRLTTIGVSPHAVYTVTPLDSHLAAAFAARSRSPLTMHFAETAEEVRWIVSGDGPVEEFVVRHGLPTAASRRSDTPRRFPEPGAAFGQLARDTVTAGGCGSVAGVLHGSAAAIRPPLLAHVNYVEECDLEVLADRAIPVVFCPRTHRYFGHPEHPWRRMVQRNITVCLGTDSLASNPSLSILDEIQFLGAVPSPLPFSDLVQLATLNSAKALGLEDRIGSLRAGKQADLVAAVTPSLSWRPDQSRSASGPLAVTDVWVAGQRVVRRSALASGFFA